ncbi:MAG: hypothetical protein ACTSWR_00765 [Candidatus Helarchaeota archaeon]
MAKNEPKSMLEKLDEVLNEVLKHISNLDAKFENFDNTISKVVSISSESLLNMYNRVEELERKLESFIMSVDALFSYMRDRKIIDETDLQKYTEDIAKNYQRRK